MLEYYELLNKWDEFPWEWMGWGVPMVGPTHSYICEFLANYAEDGEKHFLVGHPSFFELKRYAEESPISLSNGIYSYCLELYNKSKYDRSCVAQEVLNYLCKDHRFRKDFQELFKKKRFYGYI